jgi:hypothetical protein
VPGLVRPFAARRGSETLTRENRRDSASGDGIADVAELQPAVPDVFRIDVGSACFTQYFRDVERVWGWRRL